LRRTGIESIYGIVNGTCNYILTLMTNEGRKFDEVLKEAQAKGYAEADPTFDIEGIDSAHKLAVLTMLAFGTPVKFEDIYTEGIIEDHAARHRICEELGYKIKLLAITKMVNARSRRGFTRPCCRESSQHRHGGRCVQCAQRGRERRGLNDVLRQGAGDMPTGSAVVSDIMDIGRDILAGCTGRMPVASFRERTPLTIRRNGMTSRRATTCGSRRSTSPASLSRISGVLGKNNISIESGDPEGAAEPPRRVPLVMMTHEAVTNSAKP